MILKKKKKRGWLALDVMGMAKEWPRADAQACMCLTSTRISSQRVHPSLHRLLEILHDHRLTSDYKVKIYT